MSVVSVTESHDGREGEIGTDSATLRRVFWVRTDNTKDGAIVALNAPGVPLLYSVYFDGLVVNLNYVAKRKTATNHSDSQKLWKVEIEYEAKSSENDDEQNPVNKPATYSWSDFSTAVEMLVDTAERKCENTAYQPFDPPIETLKVTDVLTITRAEASYDSNAMAYYKNTLNPTPIFGWGARTGRMDSISATSEFDPEYGAYWNVTYAIHFRLESSWVPTIAQAQLIGATNIGPWDEARRNVGTRYKNGSKVDTARGIDGYEFSDPVDLKEDGEKLAFADRATPFYIVFKPFADKSWSALRLEP